MPKQRWPVFGFHISMTLDEARARASQLNTQDFLKRQEERIRKFQLDREENRKRFTSVLPEVFVDEFESRFIRVRDSETKNGKRRVSRATTIWQAAQRMIIGLQIEPSEWFYHTHEIYDYFYDKKYSVRYIHSILKLANLWGFFICKKMARPFLPVPTPKGYERQRLIAAFYERERCTRRPSAPLSPELLTAAFGKMNRENYYWLYLSIWLGLRPKEIDSLKNREYWTVESLSNGRKVLWGISN